MTLLEWGVIYESDKALHHHFCDFYESIIGEPESILEFGILNGSSLRMWRDRYPHAKVTGFDIHRKESIEGVSIYKADCTESKVADCWLDNSVDLIIDDASHLTKDQIKAFEIWWPKAKKFYIIEDVHTMGYSEYNPDKIDLKAWVKSLGIKHEYFWRDPSDESDSGTLIFYK